MQRVLWEEVGDLGYGFAEFGAGFGVVGYCLGGGLVRFDDDDDVAGW